jgi:PAS domain S-box-containing protein
MWMNRARETPMICKWSCTVPFRDRTESLTLSERRFRRLFADAPAGMALLSPTGLILDANDALCAIARADIDDLVGHDFRDFVRPRDRHLYSERFKLLFARGIPGRVERVLLAADGTEYVAEVSATVLEDEGLVVVHVQDVTEARRLRDALAERNEQLEQADRLKDEVISVVSHDLRTPLTSIMGYLELALGEEPYGELSDERRDFLLVAQRNAQRLHRLVEDLLFVSRLRSGRGGLELEPHDVAALARDAVENALPTAAAGAIALEADCPDEVMAVVDAHRVSEAVENLLSNALKFTPPGGRVDVGVNADAESVAIRVADTGVGVGGEDLAHLFDRFFRTSSAASVPGAGLGLSIVKAIVDAHDGLIAVDSTPGAGTTIELSLPRSPVRGSF